MSYSVYILYSEAISKFYIGSCQNLEVRLKQHNSGYSRFTKTGIPWRIVWSKEVLDRTEALQLENKIKKRGAKRFIDDTGLVSRGAPGAKVVGSNPATPT